MDSGHKEYGSDLDTQGKGSKPKPQLTEIRGRPGGSLGSRHKKAKPQHTEIWAGGGGSRHKK
jgi:hypothetical protein